MGVPAKRSLGQNFLADPRTAARIASALEISPGAEPVLEIGPGRGAMTRPLLEAAGRLAAVELDRDLAAALRAAHGDALVVIEGDVLALPLADVASRLGFAAGTPLAVAGNLPYNISKPVADKLVRERAAVGRAVLMFQKEVGDRFTSRPGDDGWGPQAILVQEAYAVERLFDLPPGAFRPAPKVTSTVTRWVRRPGDPLAGEEEALRRVLAACFAHRRQTLGRNLRSAFGPGRAEALLAAAGVEPGVRAEALPPAAFRAMARLP